MGLQPYANGNDALICHRDRRALNCVFFNYPGRGAGPFPTVILLHGCGRTYKGRKGTVPLAHAVKESLVGFRKTNEDKDGKK
jgi:hypothetical protein